MVKLSSTGALLVTSLLMAGSTWSGPSVQRDAPAGSVVVPDRPLPMTNVCLSLFLAGGAIAVLLRRTQRSARQMRVAL